MMDMRTGKVAWSVRGYLIYVLALPLVPAFLYLVNGGSLARLAAMSGSIALLIAAAV